MAQAISNGVVIAESDNTQKLEGNHYFPPDAIRWEYSVKSAHRTTCPWKGIANYYDIQLDGKVNPNAAWSYPHPSKAAQNIQDHVAFWRGVKINT